MVRKSGVALGVGPETEPGPRSMDVAEDEDRGRTSAATHCSLLGVAPVTWNAQGPSKKTVSSVRHPHPLCRSTASIVYWRFRCTTGRLLRLASHLPSV